MNLRTYSMDELARRWLSTGETEVANEIATRVLADPDIGDHHFASVSYGAIAAVNRQIEALHEKNTQAMTRVAEVLALLARQAALFDELNLQEELENDDVQPD